MLRFFCLLPMLLPIIGSAQNSEPEKLPNSDYPVFEGCALVVTNLEGKRVEAAPFKMLSDGDLRIYEANTSFLKAQIVDAKGRLVKRSKVPGLTIGDNWPFVFDFDVSAVLQYAQLPALQTAGSQAYQLQEDSEPELLQHWMDPVSNRLKGGFSGSNCGPLSTFDKEASRNQSDHINVFFDDCKADRKAFVSCNSGI